MYEDQITQEEEQKYGCLNVYAWYNRKSSELIIDVLSAENLVPQDINGLSDPFVQITWVQIRFWGNRFVGGHIILV